MSFLKISQILMEFSHEHKERRFFFKTVKILWYFSCLSIQLRVVLILIKFTKKNTQISPNFHWKGQIWLIFGDKMTILEMMFSADYKHKKVLFGPLFGFWTLCLSIWTYCLGSSYSDLYLLAGPLDLYSQTWTFGCAILDLNIWTYLDLCYL